MKIGALLGIVLALPAVAGAEDKVSAELDGSAEVVGISQAGVLESDAVARTYAWRPATAKVSVVTNEGRVHRVETYFEWSATNGVRARMWERLSVSGGLYTGWTERLIETPATISFSRNVIAGDIQQEIDPSGSGFIEWTVAGEDNGVENGDTSETDEGDELPTVEILEEGEFDGVSDRRIEIDAHDDDRPTLTFRDFGYQRITVEDDAGDDTSFTVSQKLQFEGRGKGSLSFDPEENNEASPTPTPTPSAQPTPTPDPNDDLDVG